MNPFIYSMEAKQFIHFFFFSQFECVDYQFALYNNRAGALFTVNRLFIGSGVIPVWRLNISRDIR